MNVVDDDSPRRRLFDGIGCGTVGEKINDVAEVENIAILNDGNVGVREKHMLYFYFVSEQPQHIEVYVKKVERNEWGGFIAFVQREVLNFKSSGK